MISCLLLLSTYTNQNNFIHKVKFYASDRSLWIIKLSLLNIYIRIQMCSDVFHIVIHCGISQFHSLTVPVSLPSFIDLLLFFIEHLLMKITHKHLTNLQGEHKNIPWFQIFITWYIEFIITRFWCLHFTEINKVLYVRFHRHSKAVNVCPYCCSLLCQGDSQVPSRLSVAYLVQLLEWIH